MGVTWRIVSCCCVFLNCNCNCNSGAGASSSSSDAARDPVKPGDHRIKDCPAAATDTIEELVPHALVDSGPASPADAPAGPTEEALSLGQLIQRAEIMFLDREHSPKSSGLPCAADSATLRVICAVDEARWSLWRARRADVQAA